MSKMFHGSADFDVLLHIRELAGGWGARHQMAVCAFPSTMTKLA